MAKLILVDLSNLSGNPGSAELAINANNTAIETALENTVSRDGTSPNQMSADLDMNSKRVLNLPTAVSGSEPMTLGQFTIGQQITFANPTGVVGLTIVNGISPAAMRADAAPALSQAIVPIWTGAHTFNSTLTHNGVSLALEVGTFTPTWTGFSVNPVITFRYLKIASLIIIDINGFTSNGTSNSINFDWAVGSLPVSIRPLSNSPMQVVTGLVDNGVSSITASAQIFNSGQVLFGAGANETTGDWTASGIKGFQSDRRFQLIYRI